MLKEMKKKEYQEIIGKNIRTIRKKYDKSQKEIASDLKISTGSLSNIESGTQEINMTSVIEFCKIINSIDPNANFTPNDLLTGIIESKKTNINQDDILKKLDSVLENIIENKSIVKISNSYARIKKICEHFDIPISQQKKES